MKKPDAIMEREHLKTKEPIENTVLPEAVEAQPDKDSVTEPETAPVKPEEAAAQPDPQELLRELEQERDKRLRTLAEYDNFRKRTRAEFARLISDANERLILQLLPVMDDFERLFEHRPGQMEPEALMEGVELIYRKLGAALAADGLEPVDAVGEPFDPELHEAVGELESPDHEPGTVAVELQKGYRISGRIIRHSRVMVARKPQEPLENDND